MGLSVIGGREVRANVEVLMECVTRGTWHETLGGGFVRFGGAFGHVHIAVELFGYEVCSHAQDEKVIY